MPSEREVLCLRRLLAAAVCVIACAPLFASPAAAVASVSAAASEKTALEWWPPTQRRVLLAGTDTSGGPSHLEINRQRSMTQKQADKDASDVLLVQQARAVKDVSTGPNQRRQKWNGNRRVPKSLRAKGGVNATAAKGPSLCGNGKCDPGESCSTCARDCKGGDGKPCRRVGIQYSVWHWPAWNAMRTKLALNGADAGPLSVEAVLRSQVPGGRNMSFSDILYSHELEDLAMNFHWQHLPAHNAAPYCIYRRRQKGDINYNPSHEASYQGFYNQPDCQGVGPTLQRHAEWLVAAGVDHVLVDMTNLPFYSPTADAIQLRPFEVLVEEWAKLRAQGIQTPDIAAWQRLPDTDLPAEDVQADKLMWTYVLRLYNRKEYQHMWLRDPATGKKIFAYPSVPSSSHHFAKMVEKNWGLDNVIAQPMWINDAGEWRFMSLCTDLAFITDEPCSQPSSVNKGDGEGATGVQLAVSPSYQLTFSSEAFAAVGSWAGHTFRKQFATAFAVQPDWLFISSWNEHVSQAIPSVAKAMGFSTDKSIGLLGFVDTYGGSFGRDIEPTLEDGSLLYDMMTSCLRVYRSGAKTCSNPKELCCTGGQWSDSFAYLTLNGLVLGLYSNTVRPDQGRQPLYNCSAEAASPTSAAASAKSARQGRRLAARPLDRATAVGSGALDAAEAAAAGSGGGRGLQGTAAVDQQRASISPWFLSKDEKCEDTGLRATRIGYIATWKGGDFLRTLTRCIGPNGDRTQYTMGNGCIDHSYKPEKALGYVR